MILLQQGKGKCKGNEKGKVVGRHTIKASEGKRCNLWYEIEMSGKLCEPAGLPQGKSSQYPFNSKCVGSSRQRKRDTRLLQEIEPSFLGCPTLSLVSITTELFWDIFRTILYNNNETQIK